MNQTEITTATRIVDCADEPIHIPGSIQPHGFLLGVEEPELTVRQLSVNCAELLPITAPAAVGQSLAQWLTAESLAALREKLRSGDLRQVNPIKIQFAGAT